MNNEIQRIITSKSDGFEDALLIWGDRFEMLYQDKEITEILKDKFSETKFKEVFFLSLFDRVDLFWNSWSMNKINTKPKTKCIFNSYSFFHRNGQ